MELDEIKKIWNEIDLLKEKQQISENKIKEMLKNKGETALAKLIKMAKLDMIGTIPIGLILCLCSYKFFVVGGFYMIFPLVFLLLCILYQPYAIYVYRFLKGIDYSGMTVKEVSEKILKYQSRLKKGELYSSIFGFIYMPIWLYFGYKLYFGNMCTLQLIITYTGYYLLALSTTPFVMKKLYYNRINQIKESLQELEEFENL